MRTQILSVILLFGLSLSVVSSETNPQSQPNVGAIVTHNWDGTGIQFESAKLKPSPSQQPGLGYAFTLRNVSKETITWVEVTTWLFSSDGQIKGFSGQGFSQSFKPGSTLYQQSFTANPVADKTDVILIVLSEVDSSKRSWKAPKYDPIELMKEHLSRK